MSANKRRKTESAQGEARAEDVEMDSEDEELKDITLERLAVSCVLVGVADCVKLIRRFLGFRY